MFKEPGIVIAVTSPSSKEDFVILPTEFEFARIPESASIYRRSGLFIQTRQRYIYINGFLCHEEWSREQLSRSMLSQLVDDGGASYWTEDSGGFHEHPLQ
jgi:hypothetical protein